MVPLLCLRLLKLRNHLGPSAISALLVTNFLLSETSLFPLSFLLSPTCTNRTNATATFALFLWLISFYCSDFRAILHNAARILEAGVGAHSCRDTRQRKAPPYCHERLAGVGNYSGEAFSSICLEEEYIDVQCSGCTIWFPGLPLP